MMITNDMLEEIENSFTHDLIDYLEIEIDTDVANAIREELKKRGIDNVR